VVVTVNKEHTGIDVHQMQKKSTFDVLANISANTVRANK